MTFLFYLLFFNFSFIFCGEINNQIYYEFSEQSVSHCVRRLNRTSAVGCSSKRNGNVGIIEVVFNQSHLIDKLSQLHENTIIVISSALFIQDNITLFLIQNQFIHGLIVIEANLCNETICNDTQRNPFSEDYKIPNSDYSLFINETFNFAGTNFGFTEWPFPIVYLSGKYKNEQTKLVNCYIEFNQSPKSNRRCAVEIKNFMAAVKDAETCIKYQNIQNRFSSLFSQFQFCTDQTGMNYAVHVKETVQSRDNNSVIVLITRLDSLSMFERSALGANGPITSTALMLSVMKLLMSQPEFKTGSNLKKDVLFMFLDNESYDYLGSHRFLYDLKSLNIAKESSTPINSAHLDLLLEFGELAYANFSEINFFYPDLFLKGNDKNKTLSFVNELRAQFRNFGFKSDDDNLKPVLPPSSLQFLLRNRIMPSIVMADHKDRFLNPFYNSFLDKDRTRNKSNEFTAIVNAVASFVFKAATGKTLSVNMSETDNYAPHKIIECFTDNLLCDLLQQVLPLSTLSKLNKLGTPVPTQAHSSNKYVPLDYRFSSLLRNLIVLLSGAKVNNSVCESCPSCGNLTWITFGNDTKQCFKTRLNSFDEFSFDSKGVPLWLASTIVDGQNLTMFIRAPNGSLLAAGVLLTLSSIAVMALLSSKLSVIFINVA